MSLSTWRSSIFPGVDAPANSQQGHTVQCSKNANTQWATSQAQALVYMLNVKVHDCTGKDWTRVACLDGLTGESLVLLKEQDSMASVCKSLQISFGKRDQIETFGKTTQPLSTNASCQLSNMELEEWWFGGGFAVRGPGLLTVIVLTMCSSAYFPGTRQFSGVKNRALGDGWGLQCIVMVFWGSCPLALMRHLGPSFSCCWGWHAVVIEMCGTEASVHMGSYAQSGSPGSFALCLWLLGGLLSVSKAHTHRQSCKTVVVYLIFCFVLRGLERCIILFTFTFSYTDFWLNFCWHCEICCILFILRIGNWFCSCFFLVFFSVFEPLRNKKEGRRWLYV